MTADEQEVIDAATALVLSAGHRGHHHPRTAATRDRLISAVIANRVSSRFAERERLGWVAAAAGLEPSIALTVRSINNHRRRRHDQNHRGHGNPN